MRNEFSTLSLALSIVAAIWISCGGEAEYEPPPPTPTPEPRIETKIIEFKGYLIAGSFDGSLDGAPGGMAVLGDINGDERTDFVLAGAGRIRGAEYDPGWLEAYSSGDGSQLWQTLGVSPNEARLNRKTMFGISEIAVIGDRNGDDVDDIFSIEGLQEKSILIFSGADGSLLNSRSLPFRGVMRPMYTAELSGDELRDLVFMVPGEERLAAQGVHGQLFTLLGEKTNLWPEAEGKQDWAIPQAADVNRDGIMDHLVRSYTDDSERMAYLSGTDFTVIRSFETTPPKTRGTSYYEMIGDVDGDRLPDFVMTSSTGGGESGRFSFIRAFSGRTGEIYWEHVGNEFAGGVQGFSVDINTGERILLEPDVKFDSPVVAIPDINDDATSDVATAAHKIEDEQNGIFIFSGRDGTQLETITMKEEQGNIQGDQILLLKSVDRLNRPGLLVNASATSEGVGLAVIFRLPSSD